MLERISDFSQQDPSADAGSGLPLSSVLRPLSSAFRPPELLSPAGDWQCAKAAVENGADAIYFGLEKFNARMRAQNFTEADLPELLEFLHRRGVKGYVTFNTLVFENETADATLYARAIIAAGVDAAIVQDVGICRLIRELSPDFPLHASTQMTVTSASGIDFARDLGCELVVLARECSLKEIEKIQAAQNQQQGEEARGAAMPLEVFIHGALCVAYSGQCLTSEALGGRSANRGECAQACRMPYELIADGRAVALGDRKYLLSPQDLAGIEVLPELVRLGVASLKIEGRLKTPEYVANITRIYREAIDRTCGASDVEPETSTSRRYEMEMAFSRGLYTGWFGGTNNQKLVHGRFGKKRGVYLGEVIAVTPEGVVVQLEAPLKPGDGVVFDAGRPEEKEEGGRVYGIAKAPKPRTAGAAKRKEHEPEKNGLSLKEALLSFGREDLDLRRVQPGDKLWKTSDPELERRLRRTFAGQEPKFKRPINFEVHGEAGQPLTLLARDELGHVARTVSSTPLVPAQKQPLTQEGLAQQLDRLGGTPFRLAEVKSFLQGGLILPVSEINRLRRDAVQKLELQRATPTRWILNHIDPGSNGGTIPRIKESKHAQAWPQESRAAELVVLVRNLSQLEAVLGPAAGTIYCDFEDPKKYRDAVKLFRASGSSAANAKIFVAPPRIFKMGEEWTLKQVRSSEADGYLVRNYDHLVYFADQRRIGDYSLNVSNRRAAEYFKTRFGLERVTASYDLNFSQLAALLGAAPPEWFEITIHQHMPMFHMEHCVFCAFLSQGTDYTNCGRPCDRHDLKLRDRVGAEHPVKADVGCRNTVFNALAQTGAEYVGQMLALGARCFRLEFVNETPAQVTDVIAKYRKLLAGEISGAQLWRELKLLNQLGVTRGQIGAHSNSAIRS